MTTDDIIKGGGSFVYFLKGEGINRIKIGKTAGLPYKRREAIQYMSPIRLHSIGIVSCPNATKIERELHELFGAYRIWGEWFEFPPDEISTMKAMLRKQGTFDYKRFTQFWTKKIYGKE